MAHTTCPTVAALFAVAHVRALEPVVGRAMLVGINFETAKIIMNPNERVVQLDASSTGTDGLHDKRLRVGLVVLEETISMVYPTCCQLHL